LADRLAFAAENIRRGDRSFAARGLLLVEGLNPREVVRIMTRTIGAALGVVVILLFFATLAVEHHRFFDTAPSDTIAARR
jgi:hypothetical protein